MHHRCTRRPSTVATFRRSALAAATALAVAALPAGAGAATPAQVQSAVTSGSSWIRAQQHVASGEIPGFGGDWSLSALAAAGIAASDVRGPAAGAPSAQDFHLAQWTTGSDDRSLDWTAPSDGPNGRPATDYERALLLAHAAGLQPSRLSERQNLVAQLAGVYRNRPATPDPAGQGLTEGSFGSPALFNGTVFGALAMAKTKAPATLLTRIGRTIRSNQHADGGWTYQRVRTEADRGRASDIDMTGAGLAALCATGAAADDPDVVRAAGFLRGKLDPASGGFSAMFGSNTDSNAWVVQGLNECGIDASTWSTGGGKTPIDFLLDQQRTTGPNAGSFKYLPSEGVDGPPNLYASQDALRALAGGGFTADPPAPAGGGPAVRPAPDVAAGTVVPLALVVDAGTVDGDRDVRFCRVDAPVGIGVAALLETAASSARPAGCVTALSVRDGDVQALNGVANDGQRRWNVRLDGGALHRASGRPVGFGQLVALELGADPGPEPGDDTTPTVPTTPDAPAGPDAPRGPARATAPGATLRVLSRRPDRRGRIAVRIRCPRTAGRDGCRVTVTASARLGGRVPVRRRVGEHAATVRAGATRTVRIRLSPAIRGELRRRGQRPVRFSARTTSAAVGARPTFELTTTLRARRRR